MEPLQKRKKLVSGVWEYFDRNQEGTSANCKLCIKRTTIKYKNGSTSALHQHLRSQHFNVESSNGSSTVTADIPNKVTLEEEISRLAAKDEISFKVLTSSDTLRNRMPCGNTRHYPNSIAGIRNCILKFYEVKKQVIIEEIQTSMQSGLHFSISLDEWTSKSKRKYININLHSQGEQFWNLGLTRVKGSVTSSNALNAVTEKLQEFGLSLGTNVVALVTDGESVMKKLARDAGKYQQLCFAHGLHLAVMDALLKKITTDNDLGLPDDDDPDNGNGDEQAEFLEDEDEKVVCEDNLNISIEKVRKIVKTFHNSVVNHDLLQATCIAAGKRAHSLILDCRTRWNSLLDMLGRVLLLENEIKKSCIDLKIDVELNETDFKMVKDIYDALLPVKLATRAICRRDATLFTSDKTFEWLLEKVDLRGKSQFGKTLFTALLSRIGERRTILSDVMYYLESGEIKPDGKHYLERSSKKEVCKKFLELYKSTERSGGSQEFSESQPLELDNENLSQNPDEDALEAELNNILLKASAGLKVDKPKSSTLNILKDEMSFFNTEQRRGKILETVCLLLRTIPPSSVESERAFSCAATFCTKIRSRLRDDSLNALVFLKYFFNKLD